MKTPGRFYLTISPISPPATDAPRRSARPCVRVALSKPPTWCPSPSIDASKRSLLAKLPPDKPAPGMTPMFLASRD